MKLLLRILIPLFLFSCAVSKKTGSISGTSRQEKEIFQAGNRNNVVSSTNSATSSEKAGKIVFEGSNNLFDLVEKNTAYFDESHDIIIIKGNGNLIKLYNTNLLDLKENGAKTLVLVGDKVKYMMCMDGEPPLKSKPLSIDTVQMTPKNYYPELYANEYEEGRANALTMKSLLERMRNGDSEAYFELAEMYNFGLEETPYSSQKAIDLYEYGAVRGEIMSIRRLGDIWFNGGFDMEANKEKGRFYYRLGTQMGDTYCQEMLDNEN